MSTRALLPALLLLVACSNASTDGTSSKGSASGSAAASFDPSSLIAMMAE